MKEVKKIVSPYSMFGTNKKLELDGIWVDYGVFRIKVARTGADFNPRYATLAAEKLKKFRKHITNIMSADIHIQEQIKDVELKIFCEACILDWESDEFGSGKIPDKDGKPLVHNLENSYKLLNDLPDLDIDLRSFANDANSFRVYEEETAIKN